MSFATLANAARSKFATEFPALPGRSGVPIAWPNVPLVPEPDVSQTWVRWSLSRAPMQHRIRTIKAPTAHFELTAVIEVELFSPLGIGDGPLVALADDVRGIYQAQEVGSVTYFEPRPVFIGERRWNQATVLAEATLSYFA